MKMKLALLLMLSLAGRARAQTQAQLNAQACAGYQAADQQLNTLYRHVQQLYAQNATFLKAFKASQVAWLRFRDAQLEALFPNPPGQDKPQTYGSVYSMCRCSVLTELTQARNRQLRAWATGTDEGDVCSGSVRVKK